MFETVNSTVYAKPNRITVFEAVSFSIVVHAAVVAAAIATNVWQVTFPTQSPAMVIAFAFADPTPPPPPPAAPKPVPSKPVQQVAAVSPEQIVAPTVIPDEIPVVEAPLIAVALSDTDANAVAGVEGGSAGGTAAGQVGGSIGGVEGSVVETAPPDRMVHVARDKPLPMFPLSQVYPPYPEKARLQLWEDDLVVRYVIGTDGRIKDVQVVRNPEHSIFVAGTVRAIRTWRFKPLIRGGEKLEVVHELTIQYRLGQEG